MLRLRKLIGRDFNITPFAELPRSHQLAIAFHLVVDVQRWDTSPLELPVSGGPRSKALLNDLLSRALPRYIQRYGETKAGVACMPRSRLEAAVLADPEIADSFKSWAEYHRWYCDQGDVPTHSNNERWPVLLSRRDDETIQDGWHRFHSYTRDGVAEIPAVFDAEGFTT